MKVSERATQIWSVLALAARNRQILTYTMLEQLTGLARVGLGQSLEPIQSYCLLRQLPPLTILVVQEATGIPGAGASMVNTPSPYQTGSGGDPRVRERGGEKCRVRGAIDHVRLRGL